MRQEGLRTTDQGARTSLPSAKVALLTAVLAACSSSTSSPSSSTSAGAATLDGTFTFMPAHYAGGAAAIAGDLGGMNIVVTSLRGSDSCSAAGLASDANVARVFRVALTVDAKMLHPGRYALGDGWQATYRMADAQCASADEGDAIGGTLEIDAVGASIEGVADMAFAGGRVIASFNASPCQALPSPAGTACMQVTGCPAGSGADSSPTPTLTCNQIP